MTSTKTLGVHCLNGRRQTVKVGLSTTILQVLQEVCVKQGFDYAEVDLIHQRKVLDVTKTIRYANIPNNGKLEMVKRNVPRKASNVNIAVQTDYDERVVHQFHPSTNLFNVLKQLEGDPGSFHYGKMLCKVPVIIYMSHKISGIKCLQETTLESIGLISGNAVLRLDHEDEKDDAEGNVAPNESDIVSSEACDQIKPSPPQSSEVNGTVATGASDSDSCNAHEDKRGRVITDHSTEPVIKRPKSDPGPEVKVNTDPVLPHDGITEEDIARVSAAIQPFPEFKFPETPAQQFDISTVEAIDPKQMMAVERLSMPCDRRPCVFNFNDINSKVAVREDPGDSFYEPTIEDLRLRIHALRSVTSEDTQLMTKSMRVAKKMEKAFQYKQIVIRIQFPGRIVIQGIFRPLETVNAVKDFVRDYLQNREEKFDFYTTPPKCVLKNQDQTLHDAKLIPAALVHVSCNESIDTLLKKSLLDSLITFEEADRIAFDVLNRCPKQTTSFLSSDDHSEEHNAPKSDVQPRSPPAAFMESKAAQSTRGKTPKWFKPGRR